MTEAGATSLTFIRDVLESSFGIDRAAVEERATLYDLGLDSLQISDFLLLLREELGPLADAVDEDSLEEIVADARVATVVALVDRANGGGAPPR